MNRKNKFSKNVFKTISVLCFLFAIILGALSPSFFNDSKLKSTFADEMSKNEEISTNIFIYDPIFSTIYDEKIYFIDAYDNMLKTAEYNKYQSKFDNSPLDLSKYADFDYICASSVDNYFFVVISSESENKLLCIELESFEIYEVELSEKFIQISVSKKSENIFYMALTAETTEKNSVIYVLDFSEPAQSSVKPKVSIYKLNIAKSTQNENLKELNKSLFKILILPQASDNVATLIFVYEWSVGFQTVTLKPSGITIDSISPVSISGVADKTIEFTDANVINIESTPYLLISYLEIEEHDNIKKYSDVYAFVYPDSNISFSTTFGEIPTDNNVLTNGNSLIYSDGQKIKYLSISNTSTLGRESEIKNPDIRVNLNSEAKFNYYTTKTDTLLLSSPWNYNSPLSKLPQGTDVICIAKATIDIYSTEEDFTTLEINDYKYCMYTYNLNGEDINVTGFVKLKDGDDELLSEKDLVSEYIYGKSDANNPPRIKIYPNTRLYNYPTTVTGEINDINKSVLFKNDYSIISENSRVEVIDAICEYKLSNGASDILLKVRVNHDKNHVGSIGYITASSINDYPNGKIYIVTNARIVGDTYVYFEKDTTSAIVDVLKDGYKVRINGRINNADGFTYITYNDEYGREFSGYIRNDYIKAESWSTMQIIGCVLIAINVGLLILILIFKKREIGSNGTDYIKDKKQNYKKQSN